MRILMINVVCGIRSTGRICTDLATALEDQGHEVKIAYGRELVPDKFKKYSVRIGSDLDVKLHGIRARLLDGCGWGSKKATRKFIKWVEKFDPDVIHLHNIHGYYINLEILFGYLRTCGKKIIWTLHDCWAFTGHSAYCDAINCERWMTGCYSCPNMKEYPESYVDCSIRNWNKKNFIMDKIPNMTIVTPSNWLANLVRKSFLAQYPVTVIHNGIDTSQFYPMRNDFREFYGVNNKFMVLGVSTIWDEMKGYSDYLKLADMLGDSYQVVLVGLSKEQIKKLPPNIIGIERTNSVKELAYIYTAADLLVNLSYCENYPTVNIEACACGTQVLTYQTGGSPESAMGGIVVPRGDLDSVVKKIKKLGIKKPHIEFNDFEIDSKKTVNDYLDRVYVGGYWYYKYTLGLLGEKVIIGVASVWDKRKGLDDIVFLSKEVESKIIVIGVTEKQKSTLTDNIISYNRTNDTEELRKLYSVADCYVNPTYEDNYPTTNIEAISCGTPVVTYNTGGSRESASLFGITLKRKERISKGVDLLFEDYYGLISSIDRKIFDRKLSVEKYIEIIKND